MEFQDYYTTLGLSKTATAKEIKQAYRKLARRFHPDVNPADKTAEARFKALNEAYEVLGNPDTRRKYDELGANWRLYEQAPQPGPGPGSWGQWTGHFSSGQTRAASDQDLHGMFADGDPFSDFFHTFFGGSGPAAGRSSRPFQTARARRGRHVEQPIELSLEDAFHGVRRSLSLSTHGHARTVDVRIPAGVGDGARVRVAGRGEAGTGSAPAGDLHLRVRLKPHPRFQRKGSDLYATVLVPVTTAVLGGAVSVSTLDDRPLQLKIPPMTQAGQIFRLKGHGMPAVRKPADRGDLYATVAVQVPCDLTAEQRAHYEALARLDAHRTTPG